MKKTKSKLTWLADTEELLDLLLVGAMEGRGGGQCIGLSTHLAASLPGCLAG